MRNSLRRSPHGSAAARNRRRSTRALHFFESEEVKAALTEVVRAAFDDGVQSERKRVAEVLQAPGVASYPLLAFELAIDGASVAQVSAVIARTEVAVQARIHPTKSSPLESATPTLH